MKDSKVYSVRSNPSLLVEIDKLAKRLKRKRNYIINQLLKSGLKRCENERDSEL